MISCADLAEMSNTTEEVIGQHAGNNPDEKANIPTELVTFLVTCISLMIVGGKSNLVKSICSVPTDGSWNSMISTHPSGQIFCNFSDMSLLFYGQRARNEHEKWADTP